jgi:hypothetical protein
VQTGYILCCIQKMCIDGDEGQYLSLTLSASGLRVAQALEETLPLGYMKAIYVRST